MAEAADVHSICCELFRARPLTSGLPPLSVSEEAWVSLKQFGFAIVDGFLSTKQARALGVSAEHLHSEGELWSPEQGNRDDLLMFLRREDAEVRAHAALAGVIARMVDLQGELGAKLLLTGGYECQLARFVPPTAGESESVGFKRHRDELPVGMRGRGTVVDMGLTEGGEGHAVEWSEEEGGDGDGGLVPPRRISAIVYGGSGWQPEQGGCLRLFPLRQAGGDESRLGQEEKKGDAMMGTVVEPQAGRLVIFMSGGVDHQVEPLRRMTSPAPAPGNGGGSGGAAYFRVALTCWFQ